MRKKAILPEGVEIGGLILYYRNGWRVGTLMDTSGNEAQVKPVAVGGKEPNCHWLPIADIKAVER